jgi:putative heme-binding domain-containing protein
MYRFMIEHPQFLPAEGKEELSKHYRQGDDKGRIYRIFRSDSELSQPVDLTQQSPAQWVELLNDENGFVRDKAHQWLLWKNDPRALPELVRAAGKPERTLACLHALCILEGLNELDSGHLLAALQSSHDGLRENALRLAEPWLRSGTSEELLDAVIGCTEAESAKVQFQTALSLGESKSETAGEALSRMLQRHYSDRLMLTGILTSASAHLNGLVETVLTGNHELRQQTLKPLLQFALGSKHRDAAAKLLASVRGKVGEDSTTKELERVIEAMTGVNTDLKTLTEISPKDELAEQADRLLGMLSKSLDFASRTENPFERRMQAALLVTRIPQFQANGLELISTWLNASQPLPVQIAVIRALIQSGSDKVPTIFSEFWPSSGPAARNAVVEGWLSREVWCVDLLNRVKKKSIPLSALDATHRSRLLNHQVGRVANLAKQTLGNATSNRPEIIAKYQSALTLAGDSQAGHEVYKRICAACHRHGNEGIAIGPDMSAFVAHSPEKLLTNILDPNLDIQPGYQAFLCILHSGEQLYGVITQENSASLSLKGKEGIERTILRSEMEAMKATNVSFMPEGLESTIDAQQMADLLAFIKQAPNPSKEETTTQPNR